MNKQQAIKQLKAHRGWCAGFGKNRKVADAIDVVLADMEKLELQKEAIKKHSTSKSSRILDLLKEVCRLKKRNKEESKKWYLKGFYDSEITESQDVGLAQTMSDAEILFRNVYYFFDGKAPESIIKSKTPPCAGHDAETELEEKQRFRNYKNRGK